MSTSDPTTSTDFFQVVRGMPVNGVDVSHWNGRATENIPKWVQFFGMKAAHIGGNKMENGIDPLFQYNRERAHNADVRYRAMYLYLVAGVPQKDQIFKLAEAVGKLEPGECVEIDWEEPEITVLDEEAFTYLDALYPGRWMMYVNDLTPAMTAWMTGNKVTQAVPVHHPHWREDLGDGKQAGWREAKRWDAAIWQNGVAKVAGYPNPIDANLILRPYQLDWVCGLET
jgi:hypothetical protein